MQKGYEWLWREPGPKMLLELLKLWGTKEAPGNADNPVIIGWAKEAGVKGYAHDLTAWCGLAQAISAHRAGWPSNPNGNALWARNWADWGNPSPVPKLGDVLVFERGEGGHVGQYVGEDGAYYHVLAGNQGNKVSIARVAKSRLIAARRAPWRSAQPPNVRRIILKTTGAPANVSEA